MTNILTICITLTLTSLLLTSPVLSSPPSPPHHVGATGKDGLGHAFTDGVARAVGKAKKVVGDAIAVLKDGASKDFDIVDSPKRIGEDIARNVTNKVDEGTKKVKEMVENRLNDVIRYVLYRDNIIIGSVVGLVHMVGFSTAYGMCVWVTFVLSYVLGRCLSRHMFGVVQSRVYKVYFKAMAYGVSAALFGHLTGCKTGFLASNMGLFQSLCLVSALLMVLINLKLLEPKVTKVVHERMKMEKDERRGAAVKDGMADCGRGGAAVVKTAASAVAERQDVLRLNERLKKLNACSSALNLATLVALTWHMAYMGQLLQASE